MRQTLFWIPHWIFEGPLLVAWLFIGLVTLALLYWRHGNSNDTWGFLPVFGIVGLVIHFLLPRLEVMGVDPANPGGAFIPQGMAVRGYGVMLLLAICSGMVIVLLRCQRDGMRSEQVLNLGFVMMACGIFGARLFFVIQKSDDFFVPGATLGALVLNLVDMTKGGLVVYGSLIGGSIGGLIYLKWNRLPIARTADLIAPGMVLGLAIGRIGCLMNGCCFGGVCELPLPAVTFPAGSPPYMQQLYTGELIGVKSADWVAANSTSELQLGNRPVNTQSDAADDQPADLPTLQPRTGFSILVGLVERGSIADDLGIRVGDSISIDTPDDQRIRFVKSQSPAARGNLEQAGQLFVFVYSDRQDKLQFPVERLTARSALTHPTQVYSAINAALLALVLWYFWTVREFEGQVFGLMLILYPIGRFVMELIRQDEAGQFGTELTISQWVSIGMLILGVAIFMGARMLGKRSSQSRLSQSGRDQRQLVSQAVGG